MFKGVKDMLDIDLIISKYPDRVPVYVRKAPNAKDNLDDLEKHNYLIPVDMTVENFLHVIRKHVKLSSSQTISIFISKKDILIPNSSMFGDIYNQYVDDDKMLHIDYTFP